MKPALFTDSMILYKEHPKNLLRKQLKLRNVTAKLWVTRSTHKSQLFLYALAENNSKMKKAIPLIIALKNETPKN